MSLKRTVLAHASTLTAILFALSVPWIPCPAAAGELPLSPERRAVPGEAGPVEALTYSNPVANGVAVAGSWDQWRGRLELSRPDDPWVLKIALLELSRGRYEFKFLVDGAYEPGENRVFYVNDEGLLRRPPDVLQSATLEQPDRITVRFARRMPYSLDWSIQLDPPVGIRRVEALSMEGADVLRGYRMDGAWVEFIFDPAVYGIRLAPDGYVVVAGNAKGWQPDAKDWRMRKGADGLHRLSVPLSTLQPPPDEDTLQFKFVVNGHQWQSAPAKAPNAIADGRGNTNLHLDPNHGDGVDGLVVTTEGALSVTNSYLLLIDGVAEETAWVPVALGAGMLDRWSTTRALGASMDPSTGRAILRLFAPRASDVRLRLYDDPSYDRAGPDGTVAPATSVLESAMSLTQSDGVWEAKGIDLPPGTYYSFTVDGPTGPGEGFDPWTQVADPYARAVAHARGNAIALDPGVTNRWFSGWTDQAYRPPAREDLVIYETHVRHFTQDASSGVPGEVRGKFAGLPATVGTGTGLDHLRDLGVNAIELMPLQEFDNGEDQHNWGYATAFFFAPEASYGRAPLEGSQYYEFKQMVNDLHEQGFAVILDVVYNHAGHPNVFQLTDRPYFFRLRPDLGYMNFSGVGNDFRTEAPMMRRLIIDNVLYFMKEHHVDGFRFDLAELIDRKTLMALRDAAREVNPEVILISEPWSFRGNHKQELKGTGWAAWNDDFRNVVKDFVRHGADRERLKSAVFGTVDAWAANPMQSVNYLESHDDMALADELSSAPGQDGRQLSEADVRKHRLAATILFTSLGIPMLSEGQEFLRSKHGIRNTYDQGDRVNALRWADRDRPGAKETLAYYRGLIELRQSEAGRAFRVAERPDDGYYRFIEPAEPRTLGYVVNADGRRPGGRFLVLANAADEPTEFTLDLPEGTWRLVGHGEEIRPEGWEDRGLVGGETVSVTVPGMSAHIYRDEEKR